tara:strand:+ start:10590 stop:11690 length:1101 start_codon:yes stop_codon:yes gene_type:complete
MKRAVLFALGTFSLLCFTACSISKSGVYNKKRKPSMLLNSLKKNNEKGIMLGHQDDLAYGIGWKYNSKEKELSSDVYKATGQYPAVLGWDIGNIGNPLNIDGVPFEDMKELMLRGYKKGAVNTVSWHPFLFNNSISSWIKQDGLVKSLLPGAKNHQELLKKLDQVADFFQSLKISRNKSMPLIFRPWHEMDGSWFWWGQKYCTNDEYKQLFVFTVDYLKNTKGLNNLLIAYSPDRHFYSDADYLKWYPGDEYVDILGVDNYYDFKEGGDGLESIVKKLSIVVSIAEQRGKIPAFTETGSAGINDPTWFTQKLDKVLSENNLKSKLSYVLLWRNQKKDHVYIPYEGHSALQDFIKFAKSENVLLLKK